MKKFLYKGYDGNSIAQTGTLEAEEYATAYAALLYQGVTVVSLKQERLSLSEFISGWIMRWRIGGRWTSVFFRELSVMLGSMTLHNALEILAETSRGHISEKILRLKLRKKAAKRRKFLKVCRNGLNEVTRQVEKFAEQCFIP